MKQAKDRIIFPLDVASIAEAKSFIELLAGSVGLFKVGLELFIQAGPEIIGFIHSQTQARVFLDLKLHDIPATVERAMARIADLGVAFATVHVGESQRMLAAAVKGSGGQVRVLGVTVLTSVSTEDLKSAGYRPEYYSDMQQTVMEKAAIAHAAGCAGVICSGLEVSYIKDKIGHAFLAVTPGIRPAWTVTAEEDQRRITTPADAISAGADYLVIGRPIRDAKDPVEAAKRIAEEIEGAF
ncbi:MAG: orotidine-5'-phosphate decarboxylase [Desulfobacterales bacterium]|nr:orotidine-5'-phosphate decarboxylase [Desulfobacterales bacterium]